MECRSRTCIILTAIIALVCSIVMLYTNGSTTVEDGNKKYTFMVFLYIHDGRGSSCGGTLIDRRRILTAAHCVDKATLITVRLGSDSLEMSPYVYKLNRSRILMHEDYDERTLDNDIALIYLEDDMTIDENVGEVDLPFKKIPLDKEDASHTVLGWGSSTHELVDILSAKKVTITDISECNKAGNVNLDENKICAFGNEDVKPCIADSGGPLLSGDVQIGIVSLGLQTCDGPAVYTRVENYLDWIQRNDVLPGNDRGGLYSYNHSPNFLLFIIVAMIIRQIFRAVIN